MKRRIAYLVAGVVLLLSPAEAMAYLCLSVCNQFAPCDRVCQMYGGGPFTTCGAWGDCQGSFATTLLEPAAGAPVGVDVSTFLAPEGCGLSPAEGLAASARDGGPEQAARWIVIHLAGRQKELYLSAS